MPVSPLSTLAAAGFAIAGAMGLAGDAPRHQATPVLYCTGCLCDEDRPEMSMPGDWRPSGRMGDRVTLRYHPRDPALQAASTCRRASPAG
jgi:hypothetical protein